MGRGPHWLLNDPDAAKYGLALANALRHLPVKAAQKWIDFTALGIAVFAYEGPRVAMDMQLKAQARAARPGAQARPAAPVFQFRAAAPQPEPPAGGVAPDMTYEPDFDLAA